MRVDAGIDEALKDIAADLNVPAREQLLDNAISLSNVPQLQQVTRDDLIAKLMDAINVTAKSDTVSEQYRKANVAFFRWLVQNREAKRLEGYPCLSEQSDAPVFFIRLRTDIPDPEEVPLAPAECWPASAKNFKDLFSGRHVLSSTYFAALPTPEDWSFVATLGLVRLDPLFLDHGEGVQLLSSETLPELEGGKQHTIDDNVDYSALSFLSTKNVGVLDRARGSQIRSRQFLKAD